MPNLISDGEWLEIRSALTDVKDTFLIKPVLYVQRRKRTLNPFHEDRSKDLVAQSFNLFALKVFRSTDNESEVDQRSIGFADLAEGYLLFDFQKLRDNQPAFIDSDGKCVFIANQDTFVSDGQELTIIGIDPLGSTQTDFQLIKVWFKKNLVNNNDIPFIPLITADNDQITVDDDTITSDQT